MAYVDHTSSNAPRRSTFTRAAGLMRNSDFGDLTSALGGNSNRLSRQAFTSVLPGGNAFNFASGDSVTRMAMKPFSPLYQESNLMLPKDRRTTNAYNRHYYETDYWVGNAIDLHTYYPLGGFRIVSKYKDVENFFNQMSDKMNLMDLILGVGLDFWIYGEAFPYLHWDYNDKRWSGGVVYNPDYVNVSKSIFASEPVLSIIPDAELKRVVTSNHPKDMAVRDQIPYHILEYVLRGENIPLSNRNITHILKKSVPHDIRGTSIIQRVWKELMLRDALREVLFVIAQNHITPLKVFKIGGKEKGYLPPEEDLAYWREMITEAQNDPNFSLITHDAFEVQYVGATGQIVDVTAYYKLIEDNVLTGLFISKAMTSGEGPTYANAQVAYEVLQKRYVFFRNIIEKWIYNKVFYPVAIAQKFIDPNSGKYIIPQIKWNRIDFNKDDNWRNIIMQVNGAQNKLVSDRTIVTELGLDYEEEQTLIVQEKQQAKARRALMKEQNPEEGAAAGMNGIPSMPGLGGAGAVPPLPGGGGVGLETAAPALPGGAEGAPTDQGAAPAPTVV